MTDSNWRGAIEDFNRALNNIEFFLPREKVAPDAGFNCWRDLTVDLREKRGTIYLVGNGASASMASHMAADLAKNGKIHTQVFSDLSLITAMANDIAYEQVFAEPLRTRGEKNDMLVAISSSGSSPNILRAVEVARDLSMNIVTLSAMKESNPLKLLGDINIYIKADTYGLAESCHSMILHHWMDMVSVV